MEKTSRRNANGNPFYRCNVCGKEDISGNIKKHIKVKHLESVYIPCNFCEKNSGIEVHWPHTIMPNIRLRNIYGTILLPTFKLSNKKHNFRTRDSLRHHMDNRHETKKP